MYTDGAQTVRVVHHIPHRHIKYMCIHKFLLRICGESVHYLCVGVISCTHKVSINYQDVNKSCSSGECIHKLYEVIWSHNANSISIQRFNCKHTFTYAHAAIPLQKQIDHLSEINISTD